MMVKDFIEIERLMDNEEISDEIIAQIINHWKYLNIQKQYSRQEVSVFFKADEKSKINFGRILEKETFQLNGKNVLDIGCGKGGVIIFCALRGASAYGFDLDEKELKVAKLRAKSYDVSDISIFKNVGEKIPFPNDFFDIVTATSVLEHVNNLGDVIEEMVRVTKPAGFCAVTIPNPLYPREGHYKIFFMPYLPKRLGVLYLKLRAFNPEFFIRHVTYPYPSVSKIENTFIKNNMTVKNITATDILIKFKDPSIITNIRIRNIVQVLKKSKMNNFIAKMVVNLHFYPGAFIIAKKSKKNNEINYTSVGCT